MGFDKRENARKYTPQEGDTLQTIAERETAAGNPLTWQEIAKFNWGTDDRDETNAFLRDELGCRLRDADNNFMISADDEPQGELLIPVRFKKSGLSLETQHKITVRKKPAPPRQFVECARISGVHFETDKSFIRPSVVDDMQPLEDALARNPDAKVMIFGHTDKVGSDPYNKDLSERRALSAYAFITDDAETWEKLYNKEKWGTKAIQEILKDFGDPYDPGPADGIYGSKTRAAVRKYQEDKGLTVSGVAGPATRNVMFTQYMTDKHDVELTPDQFMDPRHMGCGEFNPQEETEGPCEENRRVTFYLFHEKRLPNLPCRTGDLAPCRKQAAEPRPRNKDTFRCSFYDSIAKKCKHEVGPILTTELTVHLQLFFRDPEGKERPLPGELPVFVEFPDKKLQEQKVDKEGRLVFDVDRSKEAFTLRFKDTETMYVGSPPRASGGSDSETLISSSMLDIYLAEGWRVFSLPLDWTLSSSDWPTVEGAPTYNKKNCRFEQLDDPGTDVGSESSPVKMVLDPHWQYMKVLYFDRVLKKKLSILPVMVEGYQDKSKASGGDPDTHSNWTTHPEACQCLPWIVRQPPKPDKDVLLAFRTEPHTYIETGTSVASRELISGTEQTEMGPDRLRYYDLPPVWKSNKYFCRHSGGTNAAAKVGAFEDLADRATTDSQPLLFSLDDIVLTDSGLDPIAWIPKDDRAALFSHTFSSGTDLSPSGLYKPDTGNDRSSYTQLPPAEYIIDRNYIADYPDWTRLVLAKGNIHDVFDKRTEEGKGDVVGARAGVCWMKYMSSSSSGGSSFTKHSLAVEINYNMLIEYFDKCGKTDLAAVRCCDVSGGVEYFVVFQYLRLCFESGDPKEKLPREWGDDCAQNVMERWIEKTDPHLIPQKPGDVKAKIGVRLFVQPVPDGFQHTKVKVAKPERSYYSETECEWGGKTNKPSSSGRVTAAHECGHASGLSDEYHERWWSCSYGSPGFIEYKLGAPYSRDIPAMMRSNKVVRPRYHWHLGKWLTLHFDKIFDELPASLDDAAKRFSVRFGNETAYKIDFMHAEQRKTHIDFPIKSGKNQKRKNGRGWYDLHLYPLGEDAYSHGGLKAGKTFDAILCVVVRMWLRFDLSSFLIGDDFDDIQSFLEDINRCIHNKFGKLNFKATGKYKGTTFKSCLIKVSPRFLVENYVDDDDLKRKTDVKNETEYNEKVAKIQAKYPYHYRVHVRDDWPWNERRVWVGGSPLGRMLQYEYDDEDTFWEFFSEMLGLENSELPSEANFADIAGFLDDGKIVPL